MKRTNITVIALAAVLVAAACAGEDRPPAEPALEPAAPAQPAQPAPPPAQPVAEEDPTAEEVPVREDFEAEAETLVTITNYRAQLDALEKEIEARN
jgi:hypothetical protein